MIAGRHVLAVVPARSGSKGIRNKNMQAVGGHSLIARAGQCLQKCSSVDQAIISTDSPAYADEARAHGLDVPFLRPPELSVDTTGAVETLIHALTETERLSGEHFDCVLVVEPTCPLREPADIEEPLRKLVESGCDSVVTVGRVDAKFHPCKILRLDGDRIRYFDPTGSQVVARQSLEALYFRNGACYALSRDCLLGRRAIITDRTLAHVIDRWLPNIDEPIDLEFAHFLISRTHPGEVI